MAEQIQVKKAKAKPRPETERPDAPPVTDKIRKLWFEGES